MSVASEIQRIAQAKEAIRNAIIAKGVEVPTEDLIDTYAEKVAEISAGNGNADVEYGVINADGNFQPLNVADVPPVDAGEAVEAALTLYDNGAYPDPVGNGQGKHRVRFFDYDGTILKTVYTDGGAVTAPAVPDHERLLFQEWNNDFDNITDDLDVGAIYTTKSGKCEFDVRINNQGASQDPDKLERTMYVGIKLTSGTVTIEWGDSQTETLSTIGETRIAHTYASSDKYTISVSGTNSWSFSQYTFCKNTAGTEFLNSYITEARLVGPFTAPNYFLHKCISCKRVSADTSKTVPNFCFFGQRTPVKHFNFPRAFQLAAEALIYADRLESVVFYSNTTVLSRGLFNNGTVASEFILPSELTKIENQVFQGNQMKPYFGKIKIPSKVTSIGDYAFYYHNGSGTLSTVIMKPTTPPTIGTATFMSDGTLKEIIVPAGCGEAYKSATNWSYYADIIREEEI